MKNGHKTRWTTRFRKQSVDDQPTVAAQKLFDPHSLRAPLSRKSAARNVLPGLGYLLIVAAPGAFLLWNTFRAANVYYTNLYSAVLSVAVAGVFAVEAGFQFHRLLTREPSAGTPFPLRFVRFFLATALYWGVWLIASQFALRIESYWLYFAAGNYSPYLVHHFLLIFLGGSTWRSYQRTAQEDLRPIDRRPISGRSITSEDEAANRRKTLFEEN